MGIDWAESLTKEAIEVDVSIFQDQAQHFDLGIVMLKLQGQETLQPNLSFLWNSETPYCGRISIPERSVLTPSGWMGRKLRLEIEAVNSTHFEFSAGLDY